MRISKESGLIFLTSAVVTSLIIFFIGGALLLYARYSALQSVQEMRQTSAQVATESAVDSALEDVRRLQVSVSGINLTQTNLDTLPNYRTPATLRLGVACYTYWFGRPRFGTTTTSSADDTITLHIRAASPYRDPSGASGDCDLREATGDSSNAYVNTQSNAKTASLLLNISLAEVSSGTYPPQVLNSRYEQDFTHL